MRSIGICEGGAIYAPEILPSLTLGTAPQFDFAALAQRVRAPLRMTRAVCSRNPSALTSQG